MSDIYYGHGTKEQFDDYMDFINYVFGFNGNQNDFKKLLPKLYKVEYQPAYHAGNTTNFFKSITDASFSTASCMEKLSNYAKSEIESVLKFGIQ